MRYPRHDHHTPANTVNPPTIGIVANPVSARDIRRLVANANSLQIADRANIVLRVLAALAATGVRDVLMMPDNGGIRSLLERGLQRSRALDTQAWPTVRYVDMPVTSTVNDTLRAVDAMVAAKVAAIVVLGGDGTHRAVASRCGAIPIAGLSTGTNNAFPDLREPTITGLAAGLYATGRVPAAIACRGNKILQVDVNSDERQEIALVDVAITTERYIGARALWKADGFRELFVTFAEAHAIGMSAIAGLIQPVARHEPHGLHVTLAAPARSPWRVQAPIAPGLIEPVGVRDWQRLPPAQPVILAPAAGSVAVDGEREIEFSERDRISVCLQTDAFRTLDVSRVLHYAAEQQLLLAATTTPLEEIP